MAVTKKTNAWTKKGLVQARVNNEEFREILTKAQVYSKGKLSDYVRMACLNYRPLKKVAK